jgi:hypothetical protein
MRWLIAPAGIELLVCSLQIVSECLFVTTEFKIFLRLLRKSVKIQIYETIILPGVWSLTLREEYRLMVFENRVVRGIFGHKREEVAEAGEGCIMRAS